MPPPRRSARVRTRIHEQAAKPVKPNTKGLPAMPADLLLEILSYMQAMPIPCIDYPIQSHYKQRTTALRALFQTCRSLRAALLPFIWERIEVCTINEWDDWCKNIATDLVEQLETVTIREPSFANFVKTVTVAISGYSVYRVLRELARCLALMPNLQTIQIIDLLDFRGETYHQKDLYAAGMAILEKAFKAYTFPSVQHVVLFPRAHVLFHCFPNARRVYLARSWRENNQSIHNNDHKICRDWLFKVAEHCRNVDEFGCFDKLDQTFFELLISTLPKLRSVQIHGNCVDVAFINRLYELKSLEKIELVLLPFPYQIQQFQEKRMAAIRVLEKSSVDDKKKLLVITYTEIVVEVVRFAT